MRINVKLVALFTVLSTLLQTPVLCAANEVNKANKENEVNAMDAHSVNFINKNTEVGWFFVDEVLTPPKKLQKLKPIIKPQLIVAQTQKIQKTQQKSKEIDCADPKQWQAQCGFVEPTKLNLSLSETYKFEQQQMTWLMRQASLYPNDINASYQYQRFNWWAVNSAMNAAYTFKYNLAQHPELDPMVKNPTSQFALLMVSNIQGNKEKEFFKLLSESSFLVYYTRTDCEYCHIQAPIIQRLAKETGLKVYNASLDQGHLEGFDDYMTDPETRKPAEILKVSTVPTLFLYLKPKLDDATQAQQWIRVATGLTTEDMIKERMIDFVRAYRHAIVTGFKEGRKQYTPDFSQNGMHQLAVENTTLDMPSKDEILTHALQHQ